VDRRRIQHHDDVSQRHNEVKSEGAISMSRAKWRRGAGAIVAISALTIGLAACSSASEERSSEPAGSGASEDVILAQGIRSLSNSYHANWAEGGELFGQSVDKEVITLSDEADSQKQLSLVKGLAAQGQVYALNVDPNTSSDTEAIVRAVTEAGGYVVTHWNKPDDLNPWDVSDNWVAHISFDGTGIGQEVSQALFDEMGGEGGIIAIQGILDNVPAKQRFAGLQNALAENEGIELLDDQTANWSRTEALAVTQTLLSKHGDKVKGIWAANDEMALGALEALKAAGLAGEIPVVGFDAVPQALEEIQSGENRYVASVSTDPWWQGGAGLSLAYKAATGELDVSELSHDQRAFYAEQSVVTADNVEDFLSAPALEEIQPDFDDPYLRLVSGINE
jgi:ribose transport system substrate-binding protein